MKKILIILFSLFVVNCDQNTIVGSDNVNVIAYVEFIEINKFNNSQNLEVSGKIKNISNNKTISSPWYIECQFYANDDKILKLGGENIKITYPLEPQQEALWIISWSPSNNSNIDLDDYPDFSYDDLRAFTN